MLTLNHYQESCFQKEIVLQRWKFHSFGQNGIGSQKYFTLKVCPKEPLPPPPKKIDQKRNGYCKGLFYSCRIHGSYQALESGYSHDALVDFTGGIGEFITIKDYAENPTRLFKLLLRTYNMNSLLCCNIGVSLPKILNIAL